jgi:GR25 family glycosyltransferase involved in LPS biosynthesis
VRAMEESSHVLELELVRAARAFQDGVNVYASLAKQAHLLRTSGRHEDVVELWRAFGASAAPGMDDATRRAHNYLLEFEVSISAYYAHALEVGFTCARATILGAISPGTVYRSLANIVLYIETCTSADPVLFAAVDACIQQLLVNDQVGPPAAVHVWRWLYEHCKKLLVAASAVDDTHCPFERRSGGGRGSVLLTMTSCKRLDCFLQTVGSMLRQWSDLDVLSEWVCVDDASSDEDRRRMSAAFPWMTFVFKTPAQHGHRASMNLIYDMLRDGAYEFWVHVEDDFLFHTRREYVRPAIAALTTLRDTGVAQVLFNRNYAETMEDVGLAGHTPCAAIPGMCLQTYTPGGSDCTYWPHFSFRPGVTAVHSLLSVGNFDGVATFFEREYANRWSAAGFKTAFFNGIHCRHIGRLTTERGKTGAALNAYELNAQDQGLGDKKMPALDVFLSPSGVSLVRAVNLDRRPDRRRAIEQQCAAAGLGQVVIVSACDGRELVPTPALRLLFEHNDFGSNRGAIGCALSHIQLWLDLLQSDAAWFFVLEDDAEVMDGIGRALRAHASTIESADIVYFGFHIPRAKREAHADMFAHTRTSVGIVRVHDATRSIGGTFGYTISRRGAQRMLDYIHAHGVRHGIDYVMLRCAGLDAREVVPMFVRSEYVGHDGGPCDSDIQTAQQAPLDLTACEPLALAEMSCDAAQSHPLALILRPQEQHASITIEQAGIDTIDTAALSVNPALDDDESCSLPLCQSPGLTSAAFYEQFVTACASAPKTFDAPTVLVRVIANWCSPADAIRGCVNPHCTRLTWNRLRFVHEGPHDFTLVLNKPGGSVIDPSRTVVFQLEPWCALPAQTWGRKTWGEWARPSPTAFLHVHATSHYPTPATWQLEQPFEMLPQVGASKPVELADVLACVTSSKYFDPGHILRLDFLAYLEADARTALHVFTNAPALPGLTKSIQVGVNVVPFVSKSRGLAQYRYYFMTENNSERNFVTEKLWEPLLCETLCFYWGAPNAGELVDPRAFIVLDLSDFAAAANTVCDAIASRQWEARLPYIRAAKTKIITETGFCPVLEQILLGERRVAPVVCFIHSCHLEGAGLDILEELLRGLEAVRLDDVFVHNVGLPIGHAAWARMRAAAPHTSKCMTLVETGLAASVFEKPTLEAMAAYARAMPLARILYMHTKGVAYNASNVCVTDWRRYMLHMLTVHAMPCVRRLSVGAADVIGCNYSAAPRPHFSGNFWWAIGAHIRLLDPLLLTDKASAQWWLFSTRPQTMHCLWNTNKNHYYERCQATEYE